MPSAATMAREHMQKQVQTIIDTALMNPNDKSAVANLLKAQMLSFNRAQNVVTTARTLLLEQPELDFLRIFPVNHEARVLYNRQEVLKKEEKVKKTARKYGLIFFFSSKCPACAIMSKNMKVFSEKYGFNILPITMDGVTLPEFPNARVDNGVSKHYRVTFYPSVFMVNPKTGDSFAIANRVSSISELTDAVIHWEGENV